MSARVMDKAMTMSDGAKASRDPSETVIYSEPVELANTILFLLSDLASGVSGQNVTVDRTLSTKFCGGRPLTRREMNGAD